MLSGTSDASLYQNRLPQLASRLPSVLEISAVGSDANGALSDSLQGKFFMYLLTVLYYSKEDAAL